MTTAIMGVGKIGTIVARNLVQGGERDDEEALSANALSTDAN